MKKLSFLLSSLVLASILLVSCEAENSTKNALVTSNFASLGTFGTVIVDAGQTKDYEGKIRTIASSTDRVIELIVEANTSANLGTNANPLYFSVPASVTIPAGATEATFKVSVTGTDLEGGKRIVIRLKPQAGLDIPTSFTTSTNPVTGASLTTVTSARMTINAYSCDDNLVIVNYAFDGYPEEQYYELYDGDNNLIMSNSAGAYDNMTKGKEVFCLPDGNYTYVLYDIYGDGMFDGTTTGTFEVAKLTAETGTNLGAGAGDFGAMAVVEFSLP